MNLVMSPVYHLLYLPPKFFHLFYSNERKYLKYFEYYPILYRVPTLQTWAVLDPSTE